MKRLFSPIRMIAIIFLLVAVFAVYLVVLYDIQIIQGAAWSVYGENHRVVGRTVEATRGSILDRNELELVSNRVVNNIVIDRVTMVNNTPNENETLLRLVQLVEGLGYTHTDTLPISASPFSFTAMTATQRHWVNRYITHHERALRTFIATMSDIEEIPREEEGEESPTPAPQEDLSIENVTAVQLMAFLRQRYGISVEYTAEETRILAGIRFELEMRSIIGMAQYVLVEDAGVALISAILEQNFPGVLVQETTQRRYNTILAAHILGRVGPITAEDLEEGRFEGYPLDAQVGRDGLERDFHEFLHGENGFVRQTITTAGTVIGQQVMTPSAPGGNVISTIDGGLQGVTEAALRSTIRQINAERPPEDAVTGGAAVAIDPRNGEVLAIASTPSFSLENFSVQFNDLLEDPTNPMFNRATGGRYSPGSAFKMVTAAAALYYGVITEHTLIFCDGAFREWQDQGEIFRCMGNHGYIDLREAIAVSCNVYFFQLSRWLGHGNTGLARMDDFSARFGLGDATGIGFGEIAGQRSNWDSMLALNHALRPNNPFYDTVFDGQIIQVAIGQGVSEFTPIQLANYTAMLASGGIRFRPTLLREVRSNDNTQTIYRPEPVVLADYRDEFAPWMLAIQEGMLRTTTHGTAASQLRDFRIPIASKTGTVELRGQDEDGPYEHGVFVAYAPMDNPEIAIAVIIEHGGSGSAVIPVARAMFEHFFHDDIIDQRVPRENVLLF